jgi:hypothetical protein
MHIIVLKKQLTCLYTQQSLANTSKFKCICKAFRLNYKQYKHVIFVSNGQFDLKGSKRNAELLIE